MCACARVCLYICIYIYQWKTKILNCLSLSVSFPLISLFLYIPYKYTPLINSIFTLFQSFDRPRAFVDSSSIQRARAFWQRRNQHFICLRSSYCARPWLELRGCSSEWARRMGGCSMQGGRAGGCCKAIPCTLSATPSPRIRPIFSRLCNQKSQVYGPSSKWLRDSYAFPLIRSVGRPVWVSFKSVR